LVVVLDIFPIQQLRRLNLELPGNLIENQHGRVPDPPLDPTDIRPMQAGLEGEVLLRPALLLAQAAYVEPDELPDVHGRKQAGV